MSVFHVFPDRRRRETLRQSNITELQKRGVMAPHNDIGAWTKREDWGLESAPHITFPEEGKDDGQAVKMWRYAAPGDGTAEHFDIEPGVRLFPNGTPVDDSFSHPTWNIYGRHVAEVARQHHGVFNAWMGVPVLKKSVISADEARRLYIEPESNPPAGVPYPLGTHTGGGEAAFSKFYLLIGVPGDILNAEFWETHPDEAARKGAPYDKNTFYLCAAQYQEFSSWVAGGGFERWVQSRATTVTIPPEPVAPTPPAPAPTAPTSPGGGQIPMTENTWIESDGQRWHRDATSGKEVGTGFYYQTRGGMVGEGGWVNQDLQPQSYRKVLDMVGPLAAKRNITVTASNTDGAQQEKQITFSRGGKSKKHDASLFADLIASRTQFLPLSDGAVEPWIAAVNTELDSVERYLD